MQKSNKENKKIGDSLGGLETTSSILIEQIYELEEKISLLNNKIDLITKISY